MKLRLLLLPLLLSLPLAAFAIKANPRPVVVSLPDGELPAYRAREKPESAHHGPIKLHDRAGGTAGTACREAPKKPAAQRAQPAAKRQKADGSEIVHFR